MSHSTRCSTCGTAWTGLRVEHCPECHETFTSTSSGDRHRTGDHAVSTGPDRRRCLTVTEMADRGMARNSRGHWTSGKADLRFPVSPGIDDHGVGGPSCHQGPAGPADSRRAASGLEVAR
ncbi:MAG: hypothetical protein FWG11_08155 [Promicromonosporaceae bacterium]|nr:hypothetical protein [Promicromonosporaceae bacterium]